MESAALTKSYYLRSYQTLLVHAQYSEFLVEYYLSLKRNEIRPEKEHDEKLKELLVGLMLHLSTRPPDESVAWTLLMHAERPYSLFVTGSTIGRAVVGQVLYENIRHSDVNIFNQQTSRPGAQPTQSAVRCEQSDIKSMIETFYAQSEQLPMKVWYSPDSDEALALVAMPEFDRDWFNHTEPLAAFSELAKLDHKLIKECAFRFTCDCSVEKLMPFFTSIPPEKLDELYGDDEVLIVNCPRCGKQFEVARDVVLEAMR